MKLTDAAYIWISRKGVAMRSVQILLVATIALYVSTSVNLIYTQSLYPLLDQVTMKAGQTLFSPDDTSLEDTLLRFINRTLSQVGAMTGTLSVNVGGLKVGTFIPK